jgi:hypothetical protein
MREHALDGLAAVALGDFVDGVGDRVGLEMFVKKLIEMFAKKKIIEKNVKSFKKLPTKFFKKIVRNPSKNSSKIFQTFHSLPSINVNRKFEPTSEHTDTYTVNYEC